MALSDLIDGGFFDDLGDWNHREFLGNLPPGFVGALGLKRLTAIDNCCVMISDALRAAAGNRNAIAAMKRIGMPAQLISKMRRELKEKGHAAKMECLDAADGFERARPAIKNFVLILSVLKVLENACEYIVQQPVDRVSVAGGIGDELFPCVEAAVECIAMIVALLTLSLTRAIHDEPWVSHDLINRSLARLRDARARLRDSLATHGCALSAVSESPAVYGGKPFPSAHHATFMIAGEALDSVALATTLEGRDIYILASEVPPSGPGSGVVECLAVARAILRLPVSEFASLLATIQKEIGIAARHESSFDHLSPRAFATRRKLKKRRGRKANPERDRQILEAWQSGIFATMQDVGTSFGGISRSAVSKAIRRASRVPR